MKAPKCKAHNICYCDCLLTPGERVAVGLPAMPFAMDAAPVALDALSDDMRSLLEKAIEIGSRKPARRSTPATQDAREDFDQIYARLKEEKRNEPVYVYDQD